MKLLVRTDLRITKLPDGDLRVHAALRALTPPTRPQGEQGGEAEKGQKYLVEDDRAAFGGESVGVREMLVLDDPSGSHISFRRSL